MRRLVAVLCLVPCMGAMPPSSQPRAAPLRLVQSISLPDIQGRLDHFNVDLKRRRLFIAALAHHTVEVVDLNAGKWQRSLPGFEKPQGVWYVEKVDKLFVADGEQGDCKVFSGQDLRLLAAVALDRGPDHEAYDSVTNQLYVGYGGEDAGKDYGELAIIAVASDRHVGDIRTDAHPGAVIIDTPGQTLLLTMPKSREIAMADQKTRTITEKWQIPEQLPVALALDAAGGRLFVGTRQPPSLLVFDLRSHQLIASLPSVGVMDDLYFDAARRRVYASGGEGFIAVYQQRDPDHYSEIGRIATGPAARTSLWVPELNRYYVAVPASDSHPAEIRVYEPQP